MLAIEPIRTGRVYFWVIDQITERESSDVDRWGNWDYTLGLKREDYHYPDVLASIRTLGFLRPLDADIEAGELRLSDGHHRLAAAIDLDYETVPVFVHAENTISYDSGCWDSNEPIHTAGWF